MKKILSAITFLALFSFSIWVFPVLAQDERPKGLEDRGPLTKITFIHYKDEKAKSPGASKDKGGSACYGYLANGAKWKSNESYFINPNNLSLKSADVKNAIDAGVAEWENYGGNIFGPGELDKNAPYDTSIPDGLNVAAFGAYPDTNVIAVTTVWGYFYGPPRTRQIVEWDMLFNTGFQWGVNGDATDMDVQNIATHELGHSAGISDLYTTNCNLETMYGYSTEGETIKRDLNKGDIAGITALYR
ncbi:peptidase M10A and M12B matrixin and adamalysin [Candidatus Microgenomates bacterium]|nr:peptidase M10A and M12B matrixin and adamalysin [Candidatus Microgenomates bacterium]